MNDVVQYDKQAEDLGLKLTKSEVVTPRLTIVQPTSEVASEVGQGKYYLSMTGEALDKFDAVLFTNGLGRVLLNPNLQDKTNRVICGSYDRIEPMSRIKEPKAKSCIDCRFSKKGYFEVVDPNDAKKGKFQCPETIFLVGMMKDSFVPFIFTTRMSSTFPTAAMLQGLKFKCAANDMKRKKAVPPGDTLNGTPSQVYQFPITFSLVKGTSGQGTYYVPKFIIGDYNSNEEFKPYFDMFKNFSFDRAVDAEEEDGRGADRKPAGYDDAEVA